MASSTSIEWTQRTWNPVVGCTKVSDGCKNCYAERMSTRLSSMARHLRLSGGTPGKKAYYEKVVDASGRWNRHVETVDEALAEPLSWRRPQIVFVNSMSDLFHEGVPTSFIRRVFSVMEESSRHIFQVLTKRPERARDLASTLPWPFNVWVGTSVETEDVLDRVEALRQVPASVRFLSLEPLLGPLPSLALDEIDWVIVGGESGPHARPMDAAWVRQLRDKAVDSGVPFFFKQWGGTNKKASGRVLDGRTWDELPGNAAMHG